MHFALAAHRPAVYYQPFVLRRPVVVVASLVMEPPARVLIVDDDPDTLRLYGFALALMGLDVVSVASGEEALRAVRDLPPHVVVTDLAMPGMDGVELCVALKAEASTRDIPVLAVSGQAQTSVGERARAAGCEDVLAKPCAPDDLFTSIHRAIELAESTKHDAQRLEASSPNLSQTNEARADTPRLRQNRR